MFPNVLLVAVLILKRFRVYQKQVVLHYGAYFQEKYINNGTAIVVVANGKKQDEIRKVCSKHGLNVLEAVANDIAFMIRKSKFLKISVDKKKRVW